MRESITLLNNDAGLILSGFLAHMIEVTIEDPELFSAVLFYKHYPIGKPDRSAFPGFRTENMRSL